MVTTKDIKDILDQLDVECKATDKLGSKAIGYDVKGASDLERANKILENFMGQFRLLASSAEVFLKHSELAKQRVEKEIEAIVEKKQSGKDN